MSERKDSIRNHLVSRHCESWPILESLSLDQLPTSVYSHGTDTWTAGEVLAHLADSETGLQFQLKRLAAGEDGVPEDFELDRWNRSAARRNAEHSLDELREKILHAYEQALALLDETDENSFDMRGRVATGETLSIEELFLRIGNHRLEHAGDIQRALEG
jgi:hypothetical protein